MKEPFSLKGFWYLPEKQQDKIAGILSYIPGEALRLELFGNFLGNSNDMVFNNTFSPIPIIHGRTSDANYFTLHNCFQTNINKNFSAEFPLTIYETNLALKGGLIDNLNENIFSGGFK